MSCDTGSETPDALAYSTSPSSLVWQKGKLHCTYRWGALKTTTSAGVSESKTSSSTMPLCRPSRLGKASCNKVPQSTTGRESTGGGRSVGNVPAFHGEAYYSPPFCTPALRLVRRRGASNQIMDSATLAPTRGKTLVGYGAQRVQVTRYPRR